MRTLSPVAIRALVARFFPSSDVSIWKSWDGPSEPITLEILEAAWTDMGSWEPEVELMSWGEYQRRRAPYDALLLAWGGVRCGFMSYVFPIPS